MFPIVDGITVKVTQNLNLKPGISNGTEWIIVAQFPRGTEVQKH